MCACDVAECLAGVLLGMKDAEALHEIREIHAVDGHGLNQVRTTSRSRQGAGTQGVRRRLALAAPVVQRLLSLDPFGFMEHRPEFARGFHPIDPPHLIGEAAIQRIGPLRAKVVAHARAQRIAPADVQQRIVIAEKSIRPRPFGQVIDQTRRQVGGQFVRAEQRLYRRGEARFRDVTAQLEPEVVEHSRVAQGTMPGAAGKSVPLHHRIQVVAHEFGKQAAR